MTLLGIDGCRSGWCVAAFESGTLHLDCLPTLSDIFTKFPNFQAAWVDIPIGLGDAGTVRDLEPRLRDQLRPHRHSSVFTPPVREAIGQPDYTAAKEANRKMTGKAISIQAWNIVPKIREMDVLLQTQPPLSERIFEAHPELCFYHLNQQVALQYTKSAPAKRGVLERLNILDTFFSEVRPAFNAALQNYPRKWVRPDDLADALCLAVAARLAAQKGTTILWNTAPRDSKGIPMRIAYFDTNSNEPKPS